MRLRYMYLPELKPLEDIRIHFGYEPVLGRACAVHFVVGVNGSGKTRLLRAIAEIFLCLERGSPIPFPVTLVYDLGPDVEVDYEGYSQAQLRHTVYLHRPEQGQTVLADFDYIPPDPPRHVRDWDELAELTENDWENFDLPGYTLRKCYWGDNLPNVFLPGVLLAHTSGATEEWETLFSSNGTRLQDILVTTFNNLEPEQERPFNWNTFKEAELPRQQGLFPSPDLYPSQEESSEAGSSASLEVEYETSTIGIFVPPDTLKFALCAVVLDQAKEDFKETDNAEKEEEFKARIATLREERRRPRGLRGILNEIDWLWPVTIGFHIAFRPDRLTQTQTDQLINLYKVSTTVIREPEPGRGRRLFFDLRTMVKDEDNSDITTVKALIKALAPVGNDKSTRFDLFKQLLLLQQQGILEDITIALQKRTLPDLLLYDWLSDGERVFLGRMALFHLLHEKEDALMLLDEAETHFNDYWKREIVNIIDNSLADDPIEVVLSTHSSIALTDAFDTEIVLLSKNPADGSISVEDTPIKSFGASPVDIMRDIFQAPESVGQRAAEFLDIMLMVALYPKEVEAFWAVDTPGRTVDQLQNEPAFDLLRSLVQQKIPYALSRDADPNTQLDKPLLRTLRAVLRYTRYIKQRREVTMADAIDALYRKLGSGYYQFEFHRRLEQLRRDSNATSN